MRSWTCALAALSVLIAAGLAGCTEDEPMTVSTAVITPGVWDIRGDTDRIMAWARNSGDADVTVAWSLTSADGALPDGWVVTFTAPSATLRPAGTKVSGARGYSYPDWAMTMVTLTLPAGQTAGTYDLVLHAGAAQQAVRATVHGDRTNVSGPGSRVEVHYEGRFADSGVLFDDGDFPTTLGQGQTVPGFDFGLMGLAAGETAVLVIPPPFGYGYDPPPSHAKFAGETLEFTVTLTSLEG
jgi:hypothetical protein